MAASARLPEVSRPGSARAASVPSRPRSAVAWGTIATLVAAALLTTTPGLAVAEVDKAPLRERASRPETEAPTEDAASRRCRDYDPLRRPFFGDLHVHTAFSQDANTQGTRNTPYDAYRFARGERVEIQPYDEEGRGRRSMTLDRPLDFAAVTDHAEMLGETHICHTPGLPGYDSLICRLFRWWPRVAFFAMNNRATNSRAPERYGFCGPGGRDCLDAAANQWTEIQRAAAGALDTSEACTFTSFVGYEWTGAPRSNNLHRNVIFRSAEVPALPTSFFEAPTPEKLWDALDEQCLQADGACDFVIVPHNPNLSNGVMFPDARPDGLPIDAAYAERRAAFEPLVEIMQHKGESECLLTQANEDEACTFEKLPYGNFAGRYVRWASDDPHRRSHVRNALGRGLLHERAVGENPYRFGFIGSTDTHLGTPGAVAEGGYLGHGGAGVPARDEIPPGLPDGIEFNPGGLAVLWAEENSRESLFAAMRRREAYATSGPRMVVRMFGGWNLSKRLCGSPSFAVDGYRSAVPMGSVLEAGQGRPSLAVWAQADEGGERTGLERIQIVKVSVVDGKPSERVFDALQAPGGRATVDPWTCEREEPKALPSLCTVWSDPDFDPTVPALYYARILEQPTCRWSARICNAAQVDCDDPSTIGEGLEACCREDHRRVIQERAWTSPVWYSPEGGSAASD